MHLPVSSPGQPLGPWMPAHALAAGVVVLIVLAIAATIWPGWPPVVSSLGI